MLTTDLIVTLDSDILDNADAIFEDMGFDTPTAVRMFLKRVIKERRMPFELYADQSKAEIPPTIAKPSVDAYDHTSFLTIRQTGKITQDMCQEVWSVFKRWYSNGDSNLQDAARLIANKTGMNAGSAFIYLGILNNLVNGRQNKRALKLEDLLFFVERIKFEFSESIYRATIRSLEASIPYWEEKLPGSFAGNVKNCISKL